MFYLRVMGFLQAGIVKILQKGQIGEGISMGVPFVLRY